MSRKNKLNKTYDLVIFGAISKEYIERRMEKNLVSFRFCERSLKKGAWRRFIPRTRKKIHEEYIRYKEQELYILGASAYTAHDLALCGFNPNKCFQWGYFPEVKERNINELLKNKANNSKIEILYAGRLLKLKRVMDSLKAINALICEGIKQVHFTIIGDGEDCTRLHAYIDKHNLQEYVTFLPFMASQEVRDYMDKADIYILGSNFYEGWGAVVNEAMNSGCAMLVSHAVGSAAYLIKSGENGFIYECGNIKDLTKKLRHLIINDNIRHNIAKNAYRTLTELWNADVAANRLIALYNNIKNKNFETWAAGPCAKAEIIKNDWINKGNNG